MEKQNVIRMGQVKNILALGRRINKPVFVRGTFGIGKSDAVRQYALEIVRKEMPDYPHPADTRIKVVMAAQYEPADFTGVPSMVNGRTVWNVPEFFPHPDDEGFGVIFLDELTSARPETQAVMYQFVLERRIGSYVLPKGWQIIAGGNLSTDKGVVHRMAEPLKNRFMMIDVEQNLDDWSQWAFGAGINPVVVAFMRFRPELLHTYDPKKINDGAVATPRSWAAVSAVVSDEHMDSELTLPAIAGLVGDGAAVEFQAFLQTWKSMISIDAIIAAPDATPLPKEDDPAMRIAVVSALAHRANADNATQISRYVRRIGTEGEAPEMVALYINTLGQKGSSAVAHESFVQLCSEYASVCL